MGGGDYLLVAKGNRPALENSLKKKLDEMILEGFKDLEHVYHETTEAGHGRIDTRRVWATQEIEWVAGKSDWKGLLSVAVVESTRRLIGTGSSSTERRHFISSLPCTSGGTFARFIRDHWSIENTQHWSLDGAFNEDQSRVRKDHGHQNLAVLRRIALGLLRRDQSVKVGVKNELLKAGRDRDYLLKVLSAPAVSE